MHSLYYAFVHVWLRFLPYDFVTLRFPSAIAVGVAAGLLVVLVHHLTSLRAGIVAGLVLAVLPRATSSGLQGRSYAMSMTVAVAVTLVLVVATDRTLRQQPRAWLWWTGYGVLAVLGSYLFLYSALLIVAHAVTVMIWMLTRRRQGPMLRAAVSWLVAAAVAGLFTIPLARMTSGQASTQLYWMGKVLRLDGRLVNSVFVQQYFGTSTLLAVVCWIIVIAGVIAVLVVRRIRPWSRALEVALPAIIVPIVAVIVVSVVVQPLYNARYLTFTAPFVAVLIGVALGAVRWRLVSVIGVVLVAALCVPQIAAQRAPDHKTGSHWREAAAYITAKRAHLPNKSGIDGVYYGPLPGHPIRTTEYVSSAYPSAFIGFRDLTIVKNAASIGQLWAERLPPKAALPLDGVGRVWYVGGRTGDQPAAMRERLRATGWKEESRHRMDDFYVITFTQH
ncbi:hypothetical protein DEI95_05140 [Curtobacterium sp. MCBD17_008]|nr:hypothetical protein DEI95_05140 [Curtobacterium sp. MCBD17_008]